MESYRISQDSRPNPIKSLLILVQILWDLRDEIVINCAKILQYYKQDHITSYTILQYPEESYNIVEDLMGSVTGLFQA